MCFQFQFGLKSQNFPRTMFLLQLTSSPKVFCVQAKQTSGTSGLIVFYDQTGPILIIYYRSIRCRRHFRYQHAKAGARKKIMEIVRKRYNRVENMYAKRCRRRISFFFSVRDVGCTKHRPNGTSQVVPGTLSNMILKYLGEHVFGHSDIFLNTVQLIDSTLRRARNNCLFVYFRQISVDQL